ncbi:MAG TPA: hypothetical protein VK988_02005 [Acidimicrobiales bacterium]|nr:hypothetical protein [Acidimicrobiales bacterium]
MASISADATVGGWILQAILPDRLWSRTSYATTTFGSLPVAGYELLSTFDAPHFDVVVPKATADAASTVLSLFGPAERNPYRWR